jgi:hypothetical protein
MRRLTIWSFALVMLGWICAGAGPAQAQAIPSICDAIPGNLVTNCGFDIIPDPGSFAGWTVTEASNGSALALGGNSHSGVLAAQFGATAGIDDVISQTITTVPGRSYGLTFYWQGDPGSTSDGYFARWNGQTLVDVTDNFVDGYIQYSFTEVGTGSDTLTFGGQDATGSYVQLDDISLVARSVVMPEPTALLLFGAGLAGIGAVRRRRR